MNPYLLEVLLKERKKEMLAEAERLQLLAAYEAAKGSRKAKILNALGKWLIATGEKLTRRYSERVGLPTA